MKRRSFLKNTAFVSAPLLLPGVFKSFQNPDQIKSKRKLVLIHLNGGNDGYNTIVPYADPTYYNHRPTIAIPLNEVIKLNNDFGFNPALKSLKPHFDAGNMLIINNISCAGLDYSHYTSCKIWETGLINNPNAVSWIDRCANNKATQSFIIETTADDFAAGLKTIAAQIDKENANSCYRISLDGFDTHQFQKYKHDRLLETYAQGLDTFFADLKASGKLDDTLIITWSEFGRRLKENNKRGTEHGQANSLLIYGNQLKEKGIWEGSNQHQTQFIDFRNIYATVLARWFNMPHASILDSKFEVMNWI
ncbi:DUF1501 domain-containing protein [Mucilaginibacter sp.]|uniref:DUF1501 domain-containing protein n=1 Tax=Mucilaginibacter sp. TaxID=1882438 RepID=UPI003B00B9A4